jgi:inhibitor of cysteine peptidase
MKTCLLILLAVSAIYSQATFTWSEGLTNWEISTEADKEITLSFEGNPTTGFGWYVNNKIDTTFLQPLNIDEDGSTEYVQNVNADGMVGVGGKYNFKFKALKAGAVNVNFVYQRPWEKDIEPAKDVNAKVTIGNSVEVKNASDVVSVDKDENGNPKIGSEFMKIGYAMISLILIFIC